jgi:hypothetical protein
VQGVQFRLLALDSALGTLSQNPAHGPVLAELALRNQLAAQCITIGAYFQVATQATASLCTPLDFESYGLLDRLDGLQPCDLPLAILHWRESGLHFIESWAVRRGLVADRPWPYSLPERRRLEVEALGLHFQCLMETARQALPAGLPALTAEAFLTLLPPAGYLPTGESQFVANTFFSAFPRAGVECLTAETRRRMLHLAALSEPIDLSDPSLPPLSYFGVGGGLTFFARHDPRCADFIGIGETAPTEAAAPSPPAQEPAQAPSVATGSLQVLVGLTEEAVFDRSLVGGKLEQTLNAWASAADGRSYPGHMIAGNRLDRFALGFRDRLKTGTVDRQSLLRELFAKHEVPVVAGFGFDPLPPGPYRVSVRLLGRRAVEGTTRIHAGGTARVALFLDLGDSGKTDRPPPSTKDDHLVPGPGDWIDPPWFEEIWVPDWKLERHPGRPPGFGPRPDPPPYDDWLIHMVDELDARVPEVQLDPHKVTLLLQTGYTPVPDQVPSAPYAYLEFGGTDVYAPVILTTARTGTGLSELGLGASGRADASDRLGRVSADRVEILAGAWSGLIAELMGVGADSAASLIGAARQYGFATDGGLKELAGDGRTAAALSGGGYHSVTEVANAAASDLAAATGLPVGQAIWLVEHARTRTPRAFWALEAAGLGLAAAEIGQLEQSGVHSQGQFKSRIEAGDEAMLDLFGGDAGQVEMALQNTARTIAERAEGAKPVYLVASGEAAYTLADNGLDTLSRLADAGAAGLAAILGDAAQADHLSDAVAARLGRL